MDESGTLVFGDLETGGLNPKRHPIIQLAAIAVNGESLATLETIEIKIAFDEARANKHAIRKNSYDRLTWRNEALDEREAARTFAAFLKRHASMPMLGRDGREYHLAQLVAHNAAFDCEFLHTWYERLGIFCPARRQGLCTLQRAMWHVFEHGGKTPPRNFKLDTLCEYFGVPFSAADAHDALGDVRATVALYKALVARQASLPYSNAA